MKISCHRMSLVFMFLAFGFTPLAQADPVTVTSGRFNQHSSESPLFDFSGDGFRIVGDLFGQATPVAIFQIFPLEDCLICAVGASIRLGSHLQGELGSRVGSVEPLHNPAVVFDGVSYTTVFYSGDLLFDSSTVTVTNTNDLFVRLTRPFTFSGTLNAFGSEARTGPPLFVADLRGTGLATFSLLRGSDGKLNFGDLTYRFQATTPEPGSISLLGSGIVGLLLRSRRRSRRTAASNGRLMPSSV